MKTRADLMEAASAYTKLLRQKKPESKYRTDAIVLTTELVQLTQEASLFLEKFSRTDINLGAHSLRQAHETRSAPRTYLRLWDRAHQVQGQGEVQISALDTGTGSDWIIGLGLTGQLDYPSQLQDCMRMRIMSAAWIAAADESITEAKRLIRLVKDLSTEQPRRQTTRESAASE